MMNPIQKRSYCSGGQPPMRPPTYEPSSMPPKRKAKTKEASGRLAARLPSLRQAPGGGVGVQPGVRGVAARGA